MTTIITRFTIYLNLNKNSNFFKFQKIIIQKTLSETESVVGGVVFALHCDVSSGRWKIAEETKKCIEILSEAKSVHDCPSCSLTTDCSAQEWSPCFHAANRSCNVFFRCIKNSKFCVHFQKCCLCFVKIPNTTAYVFRDYGRHAYYPESYNSYPILVSFCRRGS